MLEDEWRVEDEKYKTIVINYMNNGKKHMQKRKNLDKIPNLQKNSKETRTNEVNWI